MPSLDPAVWYNVCGKDIQIWNGHSDGHQKMGKISGPLGILAIEEYKDSFRFEEVLILPENADVAEDNRDPTTPAYDQYWIREEDVRLELCEDEEPDPEPDPEPGPDPVPGEVSDKALGAAFRLIVDFILGR